MREQPPESFSPKQSPFAPRAQSHDAILENRGTHSALLQKNHLPTNVSGSPKQAAHVTL